MAKACGLDEKSYILERRDTIVEERGSSIDSNENAFDDMKQLIDEEDNFDKSSLPSASFNFINSVIGSGVIGIPYALHEAGFGFGLFLLAVVAYVTDYSLILMVKSGHISGRFSYQGIMEAAFGRPGYILLGVMQFFYPFIAMVSYNVVVGDTVTKVIIRLTGIEQGSVFAHREVIVLMATLLITIPLCLYRDISRLAKISFLSLVCIGFILFSIFLKIGSMKGLVPDHVESWNFVNKDIIPAIGIMAFAFMCHHNTFLIYGSMTDSSLHNWKLVTHFSVSISFVVAALFGIAGYVTFRAYAQGDLLENYCWDDDLMNLSRLLFSIQILMTYPIECFVTREVVENSLFNKTPNDPVSDRTHYLLTLGIVGASYFMSMATDCLGVVMELNGVLAAVPLAYILPAASYLKLEEGPIFAKDKIPALAMGFFGVTVATLGVIFLITDFSDINTCSHGKSIPYALHEAGFGFGLFLLAVVAYVTDYSLILMVKSGHISGRFSYQGIMEAAFGRPGYILLGVMQFFYPFIAMVSYNVVVGDTVTKVIIRLTGIEQGSVFAHREVIVLMATLLITIPLCLYRDISRLAKISFLSLVCIGFILFSIFLKIGSMKGLVPDHVESWNFVNKDIIPAIGIMAFAFMCHHNTFLIYGSMTDSSLHNWKLVTHFSVSISFVVAALFGIAGYVTFRAYAQGDLLENYCWDDDLMNLSRLLFSIQILMTYPIECFVTREVVENSLFNKTPNDPVSDRTHYLLTLGIVGASYFMSMATDCLGVVMELNGVLAAVPLAYILPAASYLKLEEGPIFAKDKIPALAMGFFGVTVATLGVIFLITDFSDINTCSHGKSMFYCHQNSSVPINATSN